MAKATVWINYIPGVTYDPQGGKTTMAQVNHASKSVESNSGNSGLLSRFRFFRLADLARQSREPYDDGKDVPRERAYCEAGGLNEAFIMERWCSFQPRT